MTAKITEKQFQRQVSDLALLRGWKRQYHTWNSRRSAPGFPDLVLIRRKGERCEIIFAELKVGKNVPSEAQFAWLEDLRDCDGVRAYWWTPTDWAEIDRLLM